MIFIPNYNNSENLQKMFTHCNVTESKSTRTKPFRTIEG